MPNGLGTCTSSAGLSMTQSSRFTSGSGTRGQTSRGIAEGAESDPLSPCDEDEAPDDEFLRTAFPRGPLACRRAPSDDLLGPVQRQPGIGSAELWRCSGSSFGPEDSITEDASSVRRQVSRSWGPTTPASAGAALLSALTPRLLLSRETSTPGGTNSNIVPVGESPTASPSPSATGSPPAPRSTHPAAANSGQGRLDAVCSRSAEEAPAAPAKDKTRTLKYYPPPVDDSEAVSVDVIDHGSEVLIVRRDPSPLRGSPSTSVLLGASPHAGRGGSKVMPVPGRQGAQGRSSLLLQEPMLGRAAVPAPMAPPQVQQVRPDSSADLQAQSVRSTDASL